MAVPVPVPPLAQPSVTLEVPLCLTSISVAGKTLRAHLFFASDNGVAITAADGVFASIEVTDNAAAFFRPAALDPVTTPDVTIQGTVPAGFTTPVTHLSLTFVSDSTGWTGIVYIDDVRIE